MSRRIRREYIANVDTANIAAWLDGMADDQLVNIECDLIDGKSIEGHLSDSGMSEAEILRYLAVPTVARELWRRLEVAEMEVAEGRRHG